MSHTIVGGRVEISINGIKIECEEVNMTIDTTLCCKCGTESDFGCHGIKDEKVYSEFYCKKCYHKGKA